MLWENPKEILGQPNKNKGGLEQITYPFLASVSLSVNGNTDPYKWEAQGGPDEARSGRHRTGDHRMRAQLDPGAPHPSGTSAGQDSPSASSGAHLGGTAPPSSDTAARSPSLAAAPEVTGSRLIWGHSPELPWPTTPQSLTSLCFGPLEGSS